MCVLAVFSASLWVIYKVSHPLKNENCDIYPLLYPLALLWVKQQRFVLSVCQKQIDRVHEPAEHSERHTDANAQNRIWTKPTSNSSHLTVPFPGIRLCLWWLCIPLLCTCGVNGAIPERSSPLGLFFPRHIEFLLIHQITNLKMNPVCFL